MGLPLSRRENETAGFLSERIESALVEKAINGSIDARNHLLLSYMPLIKKLSRKVSSRESSFTIEDIVNHGCTTFLEKFNQYNPKLGSIATFINVYIGPLMSAHEYNLRNTVKIPFESKIEITENGTIKRVRASILLAEYLRLSQGHNNTFTVTTFLKQKGAKISENAFESMLSVMRGHISLDVKFGEGDQEGIISTIPHPGLTPEELYLKDEYESMMEQLPLVIEEVIIQSGALKTGENKRRAIDIIMSRYGINTDKGNVTLEELATRYNISTERVRQIQMQTVNILIASKAMKGYIPFLKEPQYQ